MLLTTLIVDDEPLAREGLRMLLAGDPEVAAIHEARDGREAVAAILNARPDLVFLDVQMPEMDGFEVLDSLRAEDLPAVVFVTAYDTFAVRAFQVHAVDYVLKPIDRTRFAQAVDRMRKEVARRNHENVDTNLLGLINDLRAERRHHDRLVINTGDRFRFVEVADVDYVTTEGNYVKIHVKGDSHLLRSTMHALEQRLDPGRFVRIHRSTLVNVERLKELQPYRKDDAVAILKDGTRLTVSRRYRSQLLASVTIPR